MKKIPIMYVGQKEQETDHLYGTGLVWKPAEIHDVPEDSAYKLLTHPDVFADARTPQVKKKSPVKGPDETESKHKEIENEEDPTTEVVMMNLASMTRAEMEAEGTRVFGLTFNEEQTDEQVKDILQSRLGAQQFENKALHPTE